MGNMGNMDMAYMGMVPIRVDANPIRVDANAHRTNLDRILPCLPPQQKFLRVELLANKDMQVPQLEPL